MKRMIGRALIFAAATLAVLFVGDWAVLRVRITHQTGFSTVRVDHFLAESMKGNKEEYYFTGTTNQTCVRSIFPHVSDAPCWWLRRHTTQWE